MQNAQTWSNIKSFFVHFASTARNILFNVVTNILVRSQYNVVTNNKNENPKSNYICYNIIIQTVNLLQNTIIYKYKKNYKITRI